MSTTTPLISKPAEPAGRWLVWLGLTAGLFGPIFYFLELKSGRLVAPWYLPILGTVACFLAVASLARRRSVGRFLLIGVLGLPAFGEWFVLSFSKLPPYSGPVAVGKPFPAFATTWADGKPFAESNLPGNANTILVFFRGRW